MPPIDPPRRADIHPHIEPHASGLLEVSATHRIYWEECGNPAGIPVVFLHGGPGAGASPAHRRFFDPSAFRIVILDQRGAGRSLPHGDLTDNTTQHLIADIETLRRARGIGRWIVFGGSWGSTLALAYAETHPERVTELILRGIFTLRKSEIRWFYQQGADALFPDAWDGFIAPIPEDERHDLLSAYHRRLTGPDPEVQIACARAWSQWEGATLSLLPDEKRVADFGEERFALAFARIECHYFVHGGFFEQDGQLLAGAHRLKPIPGVIIQGRYDVVTPAVTAWDLHKAWPEAEFRIIDDAGHAAIEPGITDALVRATDRFRHAKST